MSDVLAAYRQMLSADALCTDADSVSAYAIGDARPRAVLFPETVEQVQQCMRIAHTAGHAVIPVGYGAFRQTGNVPRQYDVAISTQRLARVLAHAAGDLTVEVESGVSLESVQAALQHAWQHLPLDPSLPQCRSIGGVIATAASGPMRCAYGAVRDLLIGIRVVLADGTLISSGGQVVKNVAGYDLMKLFCGSFGTLGVIVSATFKLRPCPSDITAVTIPTPTLGDAISLGQQVWNGPLEPLWLTACNGNGATWVAGAEERTAMLVVAYEGSAEKMAQQYAALQQMRDAAGYGEAVPLSGEQERQVYVALRDGPVATGPEASLSGRLHCLSSETAELLAQVDAEAARRALPVALHVHIGTGVTRLSVSGVHPPDVLTACAQWVRSRAAAHGGHVVWEGVPSALTTAIDPWGGGVTPAALTLMRRVKTAVDPQSILSPGRYLGGI